MPEDDGRYHRFGEDSASATITPTVVTATVREPREKFQFQLYIFGVVEIVVGSIIYCTTAASLVLQSTSGEDGYTSIASGLWCGVFLFASGIFGLVAKNNASVRVYAANMATSILAAIMMGVLVVLSVVCSISIDKYHVLAVYITALHDSNAIAAFVAMMVCVIHSAYCCGGLCCSNSASQTVVYNSQQVVQMANGQYMSLSEMT